MSTILFYPPFSPSETLNTRHPKIGRTRAFVLWISQETSFPRPHPHPSKFLLLQMIICSYLSTVPESISLSLLCLFSQYLSCFPIYSQSLRVKRKKKKEKMCLLFLFLPLFFLWFDQIPSSSYYFFRFPGEVAFEGCQGVVRRREKKGCDLFF